MRMALQFCCVDAFDALLFWFFALFRPWSHLKTLFALTFLTHDGGMKQRCWQGIRWWQNRKNVRSILLLESSSWFDSILEAFIVRFNIRAWFWFLVVQKRFVFLSAHKTCEVLIVQVSGLGLRYLAWGIKSLKFIKSSWKWYKTSAEILGLGSFSELPIMQVDIDRVVKLAAWRTMPKSSAPVSDGP